MPVTAGKRRWWLLAIVAGILAVGAAVAMQVGGDDDLEVAGTTTTTSPDPSTTSSTSTTTSTTATTTSPPPTTTTVPPGVGVVSGVEARPGGGSGEVEVGWHATTGAVGYRVGRGTTPAGPFDVIADVNVVSGEITVAPGVVNVFSGSHTYLPGGQPLAAPDSSATFTLVDTLGSSPRCYRVVAYDGTGEGGPSAVACASPP